MTFYNGGMATPILATKLYVPPPGAKRVLRPRLVERLNAGYRSGRAPNVTLISAPAGFGKTTLISEWLAAAGLHPRTAWLSLDDGDNDPARFLAYLVAAVQTVAPPVGAGVLGALQSPQPPPPEVLLTALLNDLTALPEPLILVLDDYHVIEAPAIDAGLAFLVEHLPPQVHLVLATRADPELPLGRLRARGQLTELREADLRFTPAEAADFLNPVMGLDLGADDIAALEHRTEGWIAGLQLAALSLQGHPDAHSFITSFSGSHRFVMDYLLEEVLHQQPAAVQNFLLHTSILDRLCGPLCDAVLQAPAGTGHATLEYLEHANLFIVPLDNERTWYRYHHLFADLLRQRLRQIAGAKADQPVIEGHLRASQWYEDHNLDIEAFRHAAAANDIDRAERLINGRGISLHLRGAVTMLLDWLDALPVSELNARPTLWWRYGSLLLVNGQTTGVAEKLDAAEAALPPEPLDEQGRHLVGRIATARAVLALTRYDVPNMLAESRRALEYLLPTARSLRANAHWTLGVAYLLVGERAAARQSLVEGIALSQAADDQFILILATLGLGNVQEADIELPAAAATYRHVVQLAGEQPQQIIHEAHLGLARICYEWNDLPAAERHARQSLTLARQYDRVIDRYIMCEVFLARLQLARGEVAEAAASLAATDAAARRQNFVLRLPEVAAAQVLVLLRQGQVAAAAEVAQAHNLPLSQARVHLARGDAPAALALIEPWRQQAEAKHWPDERLKALVLQALAQHALGEFGAAVQSLRAALALAEPSGYLRLFVDEGPALRPVLAAAGQTARPGYAALVLAALEAAWPVASGQPWPATAALTEPLSQRELEVLQLMAHGLSNGEISARLFLALSTVKGHNQKIFEKLGVQRRTEAVARARALGLL